LLHLFPKLRTPVGELEQLDRHYSPVREARPPRRLRARKPRRGRTESEDSRKTNSEPPAVAGAAADVGPAKQSE